MARKNQCCSCLDAADICLAMQALLLAERHIALLQLRVSAPQPEVLEIEWSYSLISLMSAFKRREIGVQRKTEIT
jgi:hypothetical protein